MPSPPWEYVASGLHRTVCPSGWIYRLVTEQGATAICFVPHPQLLGGVAPPEVAWGKPDTLAKIEADLEAELAAMPRAGR